MSLSEHHVLWTGGFDSTFRVCQILSESDDEIQPHYLIDESRDSTGAEIMAMRMIRSELKKIFPDSRRRLKPTCYASANYAQPSVDINNAYREMCKHLDLGTQYPWLAEYARSLDSPLELGIHAGGALPELICRYLGKGRPSEDSPENDLDGDDEFQKALRILFGGFNYPIIELTKKDMMSMSEASRYGPVMNITWFCHTPKKGKPCGRCAPCKYAIEQHMGRRIPFIRRIQHRSFWQTLFR